MKNGKTQGLIPGTENPTSIPELDKRIIVWNKAKDKRVKAAIPELAAKQSLLDEMRKHRDELPRNKDDLPVYVFEDGDLTVTVTAVDKFTISTKSDVSESDIG